MYSCPVCGREYRWKKSVGDIVTDARPGTERTLRCNNKLPDGSVCNTVMDITRRRIESYEAEVERFEKEIIPRKWWWPWKRNKWHSYKELQLVSMDEDIFDIKLRDE